MATVQNATLVDVIVDGGESAKNMNRPGLKRLLELVNKGEAEAIIIAKLRLTRSVKDLCGLLELLEKRKVALISVAESLDTARPPVGSWLRSWAQSANGSEKP
jgi:DNA invertase Pin-like site-specific DNA recombinase